MRFHNHFQNAYVTHDLEKAIELMEKRYGVRGLVPVDLEIDIGTPAGPNKLVMRLAYAWTGRTQVELIQPQSGWIQHYVDSLPKDKTDHRPQFNHVAMRRDDPDAMLSEIDSLNLPIVMDGSVDGLRFIYVDARRELGHILEYVWTSAEFWTFLGWPSEG